MFTPLRVAGAFLATAAIITVTSLTLSTTTFAQQAPVAPTDALTTIPLEVTPVCADATAGKAFWKVVNKNDIPVTINWENLDNTMTGSYVAPARVAGQVNSETIQSTSYMVGANNTTRNTYSHTGAMDQTNSSNTPCAPVTTPEVPPVDCIDGNIYSNLVVTWTGLNTVSVSTVDGKELCEDVTIFLSSYTLPANYDGQPLNYDLNTHTFGNSTAYPQQKFDAMSVTMLKGTNESHDLAVALPDECTTTQIDLYYGPEITTVGVNGHGTQNIASQLYLADKCHCDNGNGGVTPPVEPPVTPVTPVTPTTPPVVPTPGMGSIGGDTPAETEVPAMLPQTGGIAANTMLYALALAFITYLGLYLALPRRTNQ